ncbi:glycine cleavage system protein GcvH [Roseomonas sp. OT10]|uniref:glycine cleavage system protein GcvH n=1 Tax=Roseomonas cutis TaxID=2897332 RepID=UPI001E424479|nr:glycine cleavage system protein GcvH [Roseomonas sp. OT10]UFN46827.1 glycine cleavage system protein GcvH [Roseomonas sp. OT10]
MSDIRYTTSHEWVRAEGGEFLVGISNHAQEALGDVVFVDLPEVGREVEAGDTVAVVESVKAASDIYAPISGTVTAVNEAVSGDPGLINREPEAEGWFFRIKPSDASQIDALLDAAGYAAFVESEGA